jgi:N-acetylglucosaminyldiphosphoundecaprenol N-acetyl-beta-D-mannosaminyltransferase
VTPPRRVDVLDVPVDCVDMNGALAFVDDHVRHGTGPATILAVNPEKVYQLRRNAFLKRFFEGGTLLIPDGVGVVMAMNLLYRSRTTRVPGADLMQQLCSMAAERGHRIFIYGAREDVNRRSVEILRSRYPGIRIVGRANGFVPVGEMDDLVESIDRSGAQILFVALGSPRQEHWMHDYLPRLHVKVCQGIGGTLDTITGDVKRAPVLLRRLGLEWLYRLAKQPGRWRRQAVYPLFVAQVIVQAVTGSARDRERP